VYVPTVRSRRVTDPHDPNVALHDWLVPATEWDPEIAGNANVRVADDPSRLNAAVYRRLAESIAGRDGNPATFHWRHRGIRVLARKVEKDGNGYWLTLEIEDDPDEMSDGIVDGLTTSELIWRASNGDVHPDVLLPVMVIENPPEEESLPTAEGLNSGVQPSAHTLANADGTFDEIKDVLEAAGMRPAIAWREGDQGTGDVRDVVTLVAMFDIEQFKAEDMEHPIMAYTSKAACLRRFHNGGRETMLKVLPILPDILDLHDLIVAEAPGIIGTTSAGHLRWVSARSEEAPYTHRTWTHTLSRAVLYPLLAAFRAAVEVKADGTYGWSPAGGYDDVKAAWRRVAPAMFRKLRTYADPANAASLTDVGKNQAVWDALYDAVRNEI
jgi:hypothetical protein